MKLQNLLNDLLDTPPADRIGYQSQLNSVALPLLAKTQCLMPIDELLFTAEIAPVTGELFNTRPEIFGENCICFVDILDPNTNNYGHYKHSEETCIKPHEIQKELDGVLATGFRDLGLFITRVLRAKQLGILADKTALLSPEVLADYEQKINLMRRKFIAKTNMVILILLHFESINGIDFLVGHHPDYIRYTPEGKAKACNIEDFIHNLAIGHIEKNAMPVIPDDFLTMPFAQQQGIASKVFRDLTNKFPELIPFLKINHDLSDSNSDLSRMLPIYIQGRTLRTAFNKYSDTEYLRLMLLERKSDNDLYALPRIPKSKHVEFMKHCIDVVKQINKRVNFLVDTVKGKTGHNSLSLQEHVKRKSFPLAFYLSADYDKQSKNVKYEKRFSKPLYFGIDIYYVGVAPEYYKELKAYLQEYGLLDKLIIININTLVPYESRTLSQRINYHMPTPPQPITTMYSLSRNCNSMALIGLGAIAATAILAQILPRYDMR